MIGLVEKQLVTSGIKKIDTSSIPDFYCIGAQKAGTSWLYSKLRKHKEIFIPENRYIHFFDKNFHKSTQWYLNHFTLKNNFIKGEVIPGYGMISTWRIKFIKKLNPDIKVIFIMRDPLERAWSHARMSISGSKRQDLENIPKERFKKHFLSPLSQSKGDYHAILSKWKKVIPNAQILILFNEEIRQKPEETLNKLSSFLGASLISDFNQFDLYQKVNKGTEKSLPAELELSLKDLYREKISVLSDVYGSYCTEWLNKYYS